MMSAASGFDLVVRNGTLVIPGVGTVAADVGICGGRVATVNSVTDDVLFEGFKRVAEIGADVVACVHCETGALISRARRELPARKPEGTLADWEDAHPAVAEALAIRTAAYLAQRAA